MDINVLREIVTVVSFVTFLGIVAWAIAPGNRAKFEQAARLPLEEDEQPSQVQSLPQGGPRAEGANVGRGSRDRNIRR